MLVLSVLLHYYGMSQNSFGALHSNYAPTNSLYVNPSSMLDAKVWLDINVVGGGFYANNDFIYLKDRNLIREIKGAINEEPRLGDDDIGYNQKQKYYHAYNRNFVAAPSAVWNQGDHAVGLSLGGRSYTGIRNVPEFIGRYIEHGIQGYTEQHDINYSTENIRFASLHFAEIKLSYAHTFLKKSRDMFMGGITISKFFSIAGGGANIYDFDFLVDDDSLSSVAHLNADAMFTPAPVFDANGGMGFDIGFTFQRMLSDATSYKPNSPKYGCRELNYKFKLGVSIIDIGSVKFTGGSTLYAGYDFENFDWLHYARTEANEDNPTDLFETQEDDIDEGVVRKHNRIRLPTFISGQFDYNLWRSHVYVNATIIQGIPVSDKKFGLRHANSLSVTPRYESYWFEFALPLSLYEYRYPQLGASFRIGPLTIGTDKLINALFKKDIYGADFYFYLKIPIRYHPSCKERSKSNRRQGRDNSPTKCTI